ncbi:MAG: NADH-quinone oxidoreductase subunit J [Candidatus Aminicenantes bacterium]|nr:NADH-quinone oxidoreductase subunit J [Candidatus Aminicenantes bacterium]
MAVLIFFFLSALCLAGVLGMILSRNPAYSALWLVPSFASLGGLFGLLDAPFIGVVQVIIYAGAVMVLFLFVLMMIPLRPEAPRRGRRVFLSLSVLLAAGLAVLIFLSLSASFGAGPAAAPEGFGGPKEIGRLLFRDFLYPFEITSLVIMAALVGAIVLAKKRDRS